MKGISVAAKREWNVILDRYQMNADGCTKYPFGEYFTTEINGESVIFYRCGVRKVNCSAATQYMIDHFDLKKVIVVGTCAGIDDRFKHLDIFIANKAVQYDCTVKEQEPLIKDAFTVNFDLDSLDIDVLTGTIGTADRAVVMWKDYLELKENGITIADTESAAIAYICKANNVECIIIKGISDFPTNKQESLNGEQLNSFLTNVPIIMNKIMDEYLSLALKLSVKYIGG
ncbi:MAG: 5'-methylthioadenosine/S-adenosylhomocysteine nucleosidase [Clostridia bacterium]|nr:5'-methylthioadenosine/S-adenosylhomocysteine nucleosidase [Clostridia bacterium]